MPASMTMHHMCSVPEEVGRRGSHACLYVCALDVCSAGRGGGGAEDVVGSSETGITDGCEPACGNWESNLNIIEKQ